ncbi:MAG: cation:proton antiporter [Pirellulaceae bacterium]
MFPFFLVLVPLLGIIAQWLAWRLQVPSILLLLGFGLCLGLWISPDKMFGHLAGVDESIGPKLLFPIVSLSVAVILFEGGLTLRWRQLGDGSTVVMRLILVASILTWVATAVLAKYLLGFSWQLAWLLGAILMVTGPTVVGPLLRQIRPNRRVSSILQWEGILIDPVGAVAAVLVFEVISQPAEATFLGLAKIVLITLAVGIVLGCLAAALLVGALRNYLVPDFLHGVFFLVSALTVFFVSNMIQEESGLVTVTVLGICLANQNYVSVEHVLEFKEHLRVLLISCLFIVLGSRLQLSALTEIGWLGVPFVLLLVFVVRPLSVYLANLGNSWNIKEQFFVGLVAPRGIVAASVASVFGLKLASLSAETPAEIFAKANLLAPVTFLVILGTVTLCGLGAGPLARQLKLADANPQGILFAGASRWIREIAQVLQKHEIRVMLIDTSQANVTAARLAGLSAKCGNILSEHMQEELDLSGIGKFMAATPNDEVNTLAAMEYMHLFSRENVYQLAARSKAHGRWQTIPENRRGRSLFQSDLDHRYLDALFERGAMVKSTTLTKNFTLEKFRLEHGQDAIILFAIEADGRLRVRTVQGTFEPGAAARVIAIVPPVEKEMLPAADENSVEGLI